MDNPELPELVDAPRESLDVEYKSWLDLAFMAERRAKGSKRSQRRLAEWVRRIRQSICQADSAGWRRLDP